MPKVVEVEPIGKLFRITVQGATRNDLAVYEVDRPPRGYEVERLGVDVWWFDPYGMLSHDIRALDVMAEGGWRFYADDDMPTFAWSHSLSRYLDRLQRFGRYIEDANATFTTLSEHA